MELPTSLGTRDRQFRVHHWNLGRLRHRMAVRYSERFKQITAILLGNCRQPEDLWKGSGYFTVRVGERQIQLPKTLTAEIASESRKDQAKSHEGPRRGSSSISVARSAAALRR